MSLGELARKCNLGLAVMSRIERGLDVPPDIILQDIANALGWTLEELKAGLPSPEDAEESLRKMMSFLEAVAAAKKHAKAAGLGRGNGGRGEVVCPVCGGRLRYSVAAVNGHMWGTCSTEGCARWME